MKVSLGPGKSICILLGMLGSVLARDPLPGPPENCTTVTLGGHEYLKGEVFLSSHADTALLKSFGFRDLEFAGRSVRSVKYSALWPADMPLANLPPEVSGVNYEVASEASLSPIDELILSGAPVSVQQLFDTLRCAAPYRRMVVRDLSDYSFKAYGDRKQTKPKHDDRSKEADQLLGVFPVTPVEDGPFHKKESVVIEEDPATGVIHVNPVEKGRYHRVETVTNRDDPGTGMIHVNPVEGGRYHRVETVTTKDNPAVGTFHTRPDPNTSSLRPTDFGIVRKYSTFQTGQTFFTTRPGGIQEWQRVGVKNRPRTMSVQEWRRR